MGRGGAMRGRGHKEAGHRQKAGPWGLGVAWVDVPLMTAVDVTSIGEVPRSNDSTVEHDTFHTASETHAG